MKCGWIIGGALAASFLLAAGGVSAAESQTLSVGYSLHVEYDDNIAQQEENEIDSVKVTNQVSLTLPVIGELSRATLRYHVVATWWEADEAQDDWTFDHLVDFDWNQKVTPQLSLNVTDRFVKRDTSEIIDEDGRTVVGNASYLYNSLNVAANIGVTALTKLAVAGRWQFLRYDEDTVAEREDYDIFSAGLTLRNQYRPNTVLLGELRAEVTDYVDAKKRVPYTPDLPGSSVTGGNVIPDRGYTTYIAGAGLEQVFSPNLMGRATVGAMLKDFEAANTDNETSPYADASVMIAPSPRTRLTLGGAYSLYQSSLLTFSTQRRTAVSASLAHDVTGRLSVYLGGTFVNSDYKAKAAVDTVPERAVNEGSEDAVAVSTRAVYWVDQPRKNALEAGWTFSDLSSDLRDGYTRNRYDIAWRIQF